MHRFNGMLGVALPVEYEDEGCEARHVPQSVTDPVHGPAQRAGVGKLTCRYRMNKVTASLGRAMNSIH